MFCPKCGYKNPDDARFCGKCGEMLPAPDEDFNGQDDEFTQPTEIMLGDVNDNAPAAVSDATERVFSKTAQQAEAPRVPETGNQESGTEATTATEGINSNPGTWRVPPAGQSDTGAQNINSAHAQNPYYIPPAEVMPSGPRQKEDEVPENNTALIILIIVLITLIILVGIFAFAYMNGILDI